MTENTIHIALSPWDLTDDYNRHAGVTLLSVLDHCSSPVVAHLLYDAKLSVGKEKDEAHNKECYQKIADRYNCELCYHHVDLPYWVKELPSVKKWTPGTLMRLYLPELLPNADKIVYIDCDMVVLTDIAQLYSIQLGESLFAACKDTEINNFSKKRTTYYKKHNINIDNYFCAGIMIINLLELRNKSPQFLEHIFSYLQKNPDLPYLDQDMLNWYCNGEYYQLDEKMNYYTFRKDITEIQNNCILHYASRESKPWIKYHGHIDDYYWDYLLESPWIDSGKIMEYLSPILMDDDDVLTSLPNIIWKYPLKTKIRILWNLTFPLWISVLKNYMKR